MAGSNRSFRIAGSNGERGRATPGSTYRLHADRVRRDLRGFGVREADLDDLCHEVFLIVHEQRAQLAGVDNVPYKLPEAPDESVRATLEEIERLQDRARLLDALELLDDSERDLVDSRLVASDGAASLRDTPR